MSNGSKKQQQDEDEPYAPVWLSEDYDETHREEAAPLFGTGTLNLRDDSHDKDTDEENQKQNPAMKALNHIKNVFHLTTSGDDQANDNNKKTRKESTSESSSSRVGQNLLLRDDLTPKNNNNNNNDDENTTDEIDVDDTNPFAEMKTNDKKKKKKDDNTVIDETTKLFDFKKESIVEDDEDDEKYRFWTSKPKKKKILLDDIPPEQLKPHRPTYQPILYMFNLLQGLSIVGCISIIIAQILPIYYIHPRSDIIIQIGFISLCLKCYIIIFSILFIHTEIDISFLKPIPLLQGFLSRGFIYSFIGIICINESYSDRMKYILLNRNGGGGGGGGVGTEFDWLGIYMEISSWYILSIGFIYMILGTCCLKRLRDKLKQNEILLWKEYRDKLKLWKIQNIMVKNS